MIRILGKISAAVLCLMLISGSCECVRDIDSEKVIEPENPAEVFYIHAIPGIAGVTVKSDVINFEGLTYEQAFSDYKKVFSGRNQIRFVSEENGFPVLSVLADLEMNSKYTFIGHGEGASVRGLILRDSILDFDENRAYLRIAHCSKQAPELKIMLSVNLDKQLNLTYTNFTEIYDSEPGEIKLITYNQENIKILEKEFLIERGKINTIVFRGNYPPEGREKDFSADLFRVDYL